MRSATRILFTGYAPVHFLCFQPIYDHLRRRSDFEVHLSGGIRSKASSGGFSYDGEAMYGTFDIEPGAVKPVETIAQEEYDLLFSANTKMILPRTVTTKVQIFHGISFRNKAVREENANADFYFLVGPYMRRRFAERGMLDDADPRALSIGFPKTDRLVNGTLCRDTLLADYGLSGDRPILLYAPTGQRGNSLETMGESVIQRIAASDNFDLLVKLHDHGKGTASWKERLTRLEGPRTRLVEELDVIPLLFVADLLITDASSVANEYALLDRPIVFLDVPELIGAAMADGSAVDLETWGRKGGVLVETPDDVVDAVSRSLEHPHWGSDIRRNSVADLFYNPGHATEAAVDWIYQHHGTHA